MNETLKNHKYLILSLCLFVITGLIGIKFCYLGWENYRFDKVGDYEVLAYKTIWHPSVLIVDSNDADGGYYRIFDKDGKKVFELFSSGFNFDVVLTSDEGVEFQLDNGKTHYWKRP